MVESLVGLGANLGDPHAALCLAADRIDALPATRVLGRSSIYRSAAVGPPGQPDYLNAALSLETALPANELLRALQVIEALAGRERGERWGPRTLDLDLLTYGSDVISTEVLQVPHPLIAERNFVLAPMIDLCGETASLAGRRLAELLAAAPPNALEDTGLPWRSRAADHQ